MKVIKPVIVISLSVAVARAAQLLSLAKLGSTVFDAFKQPGADNKAPNGSDGGLP